MQLSRSLREALPMLQIKATHANIKRTLFVTKWDVKAEAKRAQYLLLLLGQLRLDF
jgi:hypothetical protein